MKLNYSESTDLYQNYLKLQTTGLSDALMTLVSELRKIHVVLDSGVLDELSIYTQEKSSYTANKEILKNE